MKSARGEVKKTGEAQGVEKFKASEEKPHEEEARAVQDSTAEEEDWVVAVSGRAL